MGQTLDDDKVPRGFDGGNLYQSVALEEIIKISPVACSRDPWMEATGRKIIYDQPEIPGTRAMTVVGRWCGSGPKFSDWGSLNNGITEHVSGRIPKNWEGLSIVVPQR